MREVKLGFLSHQFSEEKQANIYLQCVDWNIFMNILHIGLLVVVDSVVVTVFVCLSRDYP